MKFIAKTKEGKSLIGRMLVVGVIGGISGITTYAFFGAALIGCIAIPLVTGDSIEVSKSLGWSIFAIIAWTVSEACKNVMRDTTKAIQRDKINFEEK